MTEKEITAVFAYTYNNMCRIDDEIEQLQANIRFRKATISDCMELIFAINRAETFHQVTTDILTLLNLYKDRK